MDSRSTIPSGQQTILQPDRVLPDQTRTEEIKQVYPSPSTWDQWKGLFEQNSMDSMFGFYPDAALPGTYFREKQMAEMDQEAAANGERKLTKAEAEKQFGMPFNEDVYPRTAQLIVDVAREKEMLNQWINRGGEPNAAWRFAAGLSRAADPANLAMMLAGGAALRGVSRLLGPAFEAGGTFVKMGKQGAEFTMKGQFIENLVGNLAVDVPVYQQLKKEGDTKTPLEMFVESLGGATGGTLLHAGLSKIASIIRREPLDTRIKEQRLAVVQHETGQKVDVTPMAEVSANRAAGAVPAGAPETTYNFSPVEHPAETPWYGAVHPDSSTPVTDEYGIRTMSDNPHIANNHASSPDGVFSGRIEKVEISTDAKFVSLSDSIETPEVKSFIARIAEKLGVEIKTKEGTLRDVFDEISARINREEIPADSFNKVQEAGRESGLAGYKDVVDHGNGKSSNQIGLFDDAHAKVVEELEPNKAMTPKVDESATAGALADAENPTKSRHYDEAVQQEIKQLVAENPTSEAKVNEALDAQEQYLRQQLKTMLDKNSDAGPNFIAKDGRKFVVERTKDGWVAKDLEGHKIGDLTVEDGGGKVFSSGTQVKHEWKRNGVATALYASADKELEGRLVPSTMLSDGAAKFWKSRYPERYADFINEEAKSYLIKDEQGNYLQSIESLREKFQGKTIKGDDLLDAVEMGMSGKKWTNEATPKHVVSTANLVREEIKKIDADAKLAKEETEVVKALADCNVGLDV